jgi:hypothetical protein
MEIEVNGKCSVEGSHNKCTQYYNRKPWKKKMAVHAPTDWHHMLLWALNDLKQNRHRGNWIPLLKRTSVETLHEGCADELAECLAHAFFIQETNFVGVFIEQLREVTISFVVSISPSEFLHKTTSTERIWAKMNIGGFYKNFSILSKFSESRIK